MVQLGTFVQVDSRLRRTTLLNGSLVLAATGHGYTGEFHVCSIGIPVVSFR